MKLQGSAIDAGPPIVLSFQLFEGEKSFELPAVHLAAGGEFRIRRHCEAGVQW